MKLILFCILALGLATPAAAQNKKKTVYRKTQEVSFDGSDVDGQVRSPDGAYLTQKKGIKFLPIYEVRKQFDQEIKNSVEYLK